MTPRALGVRARDLHRVFDRLGAGGEQRRLLGVRARRELVQLLGERHVALIRHNLVAGVREALQLRLDRRDHLRVAVADVHHRDAAGEVDVALSLHVPQLGAQRALGEEGAHDADAAWRGCRLAGHQVFVLRVVHCAPLHPFALSLSKGCSHAKGFDKLSPNGFVLRSCRLRRIDAQSRSSSARCTCPAHANSCRARCRFACSRQTAR